ncbi:MAG TPA: hypothetical protein ENK38_04355 [Gammaproteobacteria bacterium]|nr:hypothetical protein [Gammaproteobacteria bacterium]
MKEILEELGTLGGVYHGCIVKEGNVLATTFPSLLNDNLTSIGKITDRIFKGAGSVKHSYDEIYFEMDENYLLGYPVDGGIVVLLLTGKDVNFALIHMTVKSAAPQISRELSSQIQEEPSPQPTIQRRTNQKIDQSLKPYLNEILEALTLQIGPVSRITMGEALKTWRSSFEPTRKNLPMLINILAEDIDDEASRQEFIDELSTLLGQ